MLKDCIASQFLLYHLWRLVDIAYTKVNNILNLGLISTLLQKGHGQLPTEQLFLILLKESYGLPYECPYGKSPEVSNSILLMGELIVFLSNRLGLDTATSYELYEILQGIIFRDPAQIDTVLKINQCIANIIGRLHQKSQRMAYIASLIPFAYRQE